MLRHAIIAARTINSSDVPNANVADAVRDFMPSTSYAIRAHYHREIPFTNPGKPSFSATC
jgi:hypothetical protein